MAKRKALVAAVDNYPNPANNLPSCRNDARAFQRKLESTFGFSEIRQRLDADANLANIEADLDWLFSGATADDRLVFYFSGHGYQVRQGENLDEVLCLYDKFFFDNSLSQRTQSLPPGIFTLVSDSCHSGGMYKVMVDGSADGSVLVAQTKVMRVPPFAEEDKVFLNPADIRSLRYRPFGFRLPTIAAAAKRLAMPLPKNFDEGGQMAMNGLLLSACLENETASASTPKTEGLSAFTYAMLKEIDRQGANVSNASLVEGVTAVLKGLGFRQTPVLMEPPAPPELGKRSFLTLMDGQKEGVAGPTSADVNLSPDEVAQLVNQAIERIRAGAV